MATLPPFWIVPKEIKHKSNITPRYASRDGGWKPSKDADSHEDWGHHDIGVHNNRLYYHDPHHQPNGQITGFDRTIFNEKLDRGEIVELEVMTTYFDHGNSCIWCAKVDPTKENVGDGIDFHVPGLHGRFDPEDWRPLCFEVIPVPYTTFTYFQANADQVGGPGLEVTRSENIWHNVLLPGPYHPRDQADRDLCLIETYPHAALAGPIGLLIALIILSQSWKARHVENALRTSIGSQAWTCAGLDKSHRGWSDRRGVVVTIYCAPEDFDLLRQFENHPLFP